MLRLYLSLFLILLLPAACAHAPLYQRTVQFDEAAGPPCGAGTAGQAFVESDDNTEVCRNPTGLFWERNPDSTNRGVMNHADALSFCSALNLGNGQMYRLPTVKELIGLKPTVKELIGLKPTVKELGNHGTALNTPNGPFSNVRSSFYWSASTNANNPVIAWGVNFGFGLAGSTNKATDGFVWCVRSGS